MNFAEQRLFRTNGEWNRQRIKHHVKGFFGGGTPSTENREFWTNGTIPWVSSKDMKVSRLRETQDYITAAAVAGSATNLVEPGSVLMVVRSGILKHSIPVAINDVEVALNQDIKAFVLRDTLDPDFFLYWVIGQQRDLLLEWGQLGATVDSLNIEILRNTVIPLPSLEGQRTIVSFLDRETGLIDGLIEKKTRFIALLKEKRAALIFHEVAKEGNLVPLKSLCEYIGKGTGQSSEISDIGVAYYTPEDLSLEHTLTTKRTIRKPDGRAGDIAVCLIASVGKSSLAVEDFATNPQIAILRPTIGNGRWLGLAVKAMQNRISYEAKPGGVIPFMNASYLMNMKLRVPPAHAQEEQVNRVDFALSRTDQVVAKTEKSIDLLREKRAALITAAVTGKIDVRSAT
jgi:type I restriction enzyme, S subunit